jgi:hypothetical protein
MHIPSTAKTSASKKNITYMLKQMISNHMMNQRRFGTLSKNGGDDNDSEEDLPFFILSFVIVMHCNAM